MLDRSGSSSEARWAAIRRTASLACAQVMSIVCPFARGCVKKTVAGFVLAQWKNAWRSVVFSAAFGASSTFAEGGECRSDVVTKSSFPGIAFLFVLPAVGDRPLGHVMSECANLRSGQFAVGELCVFGSGSRTAVLLYDFPFPVDLLSEYLSAVFRIVDLDEGCRTDDDERPERVRPASDLFRQGRDGRDVSRRTIPHGGSSLRQRGRRQEEEKRRSKTLHRQSVITPSGM